VFEESVGSRGALLLVATFGNAATLRGFCGESTAVGAVARYAIAPYETFF
jgi:hypothetical protein